MKKIIMVIVLIKLLTVQAILLTGCSDNREINGNLVEKTNISLTKEDLPQNEMSFEEFKALRVKDPTLFHVIIKLSDYYNYEFLDQRDNYYSIVFYDVDDFNVNLNGFILKEDALALDMFEKIRDGKKYPATLEIAYVESKKDKSDCVLITDIISVGNWTTDKEVLNQYTNIDLEEIKAIPLTEVEKAEAEKYFQQSMENFSKEESLELIDKALDIDPKNLDYLTYKLTLLDLHGKAEECISLGEKLLESEENLEDIHKQNIYSHLTSAYDTIEDYKKALDYCNKAINISTDLERKSNYYIFEGNIYHKLNQYEKALESYKKSYDLEGEKTEVYTAMLLFYKEFKNPEGMLQFEPILEYYSSGFERFNPDLVAEINNELDMLRDAVYSGKNNIDYNFPAIHTAFISMGSINVFEEIKTTTEQWNTKADSFYEEDNE